MSLALLGLLTIVSVLAAIMSRRVTPLVALIALPTLAALLGGFGLQTGTFAIAGIKETAPVAAMFVFAILFFGVMTDAGLLDPIVAGVLRAVGLHPTRIVVGSALLALVVHLDGSGAVTFLVTVPAVLPLYDRLGLDRRVLACVVSLAAGVNFLPWTGPVLRASAALQIPTATLFAPLIPVQAVGLVFVFTVAWYLGRREGRRLAASLDAPAAVAAPRELTAAERALRRPGRFPINLLLTLVAMGTMLSGRLDPAIVFMLATAIALLVNYPDAAAQRDRIDAHARAALTMAAILLAAGAFTGIMKGTTMLQAMAHSAVGATSPDVARHIPVIARRPGDAAQPVPRPGLVLFRRAAGRRREREGLRRAADPGRAGRAPRPDDDRLPGEPADAGDVPAGRAVPARARRPSALHGPLAVRGLAADGGGGRPLRSVPAVRTSLRIGCGAGYSGDRIEPAVELAEQGRLDYLVFECLAERTIALAQLRKAHDPDAGYDPLLAERMRAVLPACAANGVTIVTNMGAANPVAGAAMVRAVARELGLAGLPVAAITGDDVLDVVTGGGFAIDETGAPVESLGDALVSANAYIGASPIVDALGQGARVVVTGRAADPSLFVGPIRHAFGWNEDDWPLIGRATAVGHLLECAGQVTGGYFADPGRTDVAGLARLGFPIAEVAADGRAVVTKVPGTGGAVTIATCSEQLLYEIGDPAAYVTPDVVADFSGVRLALDVLNRVRVTGATGHPAPGEPQGGARLSRRLHRRRADLVRRIGRGCPGAPGGHDRRGAPAAGRRAARRHPLRPDRDRRAVRRGAVERSSRAVRGAAARRGADADPRRGRSHRPRGRGALHQRPVRRGRRHRLDARGAGHRLDATCRAIGSRAVSRWRSPDMRLRTIAHGRAGDKGRRVNLSVIAFDPADYERLAREVTAERVRAHLAELIAGPVIRYELPQLAALNFVLERPAGGGVTETLALDPHGKSLSAALLDLEIP